MPGWMIAVALEAAIPVPLWRQAYVPVSVEKRVGVQVAAAAYPLDPFYVTIYDADNDCEIGRSDFQAYAALWLEQSVLLP